MRSHDQHSNVMLKPRRKKSSREKSDQSSTQSSRWSKVTISRDKKLHSKSNDPERNLFRFDSTINDSNVVACDIELLCDASNEERSTCPRISSSTDLEKQANGVCFTCKDCAECQLQQQQNCAKIHKTEDDQDEKLEHLDYYDTDVSGKTNSTAASNEHEKVPIVVDLTNEDSRKTTWKQTILKRFDNTEESSEMSEPRIMIADSSSKLQRGGTGGSLATALRDRGPCVIPVQPNRSLPIRPAPPIPTRSAASLVTSRSPILKLSNSQSNSQSNLIDVVEMQSDISSSMMMDDLNDFPSIGQQNTNEMTLSLDSDYILPRIPTNVIQTTKEMNNVKKKKGEDRDREYEKELTKDVKKRRKSHEVDASHVSDKRVKNILKEYSKSCSNNLIDKGERRSQQHLVIRLWDDKRYSSSVMVSTTELEGKKTKEICKVVPPLRLKKVVCEASTTNEYHNIEMNAGKSRNESNYRIVTGATPRPESPCGYSTTSFWSSVVSEKELGESSIRDKSRRSSPKSDDYKIKYRRNRLRQKLRELRGKALELSREMAECDNANDTSPQRSTRLRQMMNCYEKQIENISKLLCKLSASIPSTTDDDVVVDLDYELDERSVSVETIVDSGITQVNGVSKSRVSPSPSPEPPKLSPRSPIDYERDKSPDTMRNSPPVLPRVYIAIQPTALECLKQNFKSTTKSWHAGDNSSSSTIEKDVKMNNTNRTIIRDSVTRASAIVSSVSSEFEDVESSMGEWDREEASPKLKNSEIKEKIAEDTKTFDDIHRQVISPISSDNFLIASTMDLEIDGNNMRDIKEGPTTQIGHLDEVNQILETTASKQIVCEKQEPDQRSNEALSLSCLPIVEETRKVTEYENYNSEENINSDDKTVSAVTAAQDAASTITIRRPQIPTANVTNILQLQSNYYGSSVARDNVVFTGVIQNSRDAQKVMTSSMNQSVALNPTMSLGFTQSGSTVSSSNQQCVVLPNSCNKVIQESTSQRNDGNRIMTEQFPTLGNWVARMSKKQGAKSKSKLQSGITLPTASTAETARVPGLETQKTRASAPSNTTRNNIVNVAPQWNTERWQRQQHQQRQQQLYATASSATSATSAVRPGICPPISVTQFYPPNYAIDPYGGAAFGYSAICPYGDYSYHSRLHPTTSSISSYPISPLQDSHPAASLRQMQHLDKRFPVHIQDATTRHYAATDLLKYPASLSGGYQHAAAAAAAAGLDYDHRLRTVTTATQNGTSSACLPSLLLPPPPPLGVTAQHGTLTRTALAGYPTANNNQCGRNRMIPDVVAAAAAAAVVAAASFGRQRSTILPSYGRTDTDMASSDIGSVMGNESSQLLTTDRSAASRECLPQEPMQSVTGVNIDSRLNNGSYRQLQNLILDRLPYVKTDDVSYSQSSSAIFGDNAQESTSSVLTSTSYKSAPVFTSNSAITVKEPARKENRNCETPHLGKVNRTLETTSNLECSNCGLTGSMFKCLGCEAVFYCDERCQTRHWGIHVKKCPKRMPKLKKLV